MGDFADGLNCAIYAARGKWSDAALSCISVIPVIGDVIGKGGKVLKGALKHGDELAGAIKQGVKHGDELAGGAAAACRRACPSGSRACFTAGHQVLEVVGEIDPSRTSPAVAQAAMGHEEPVHAPSTASDDDETAGWEAPTLYVGVFAVAAGLVGLRFVPPWLRRRSLRIQAIDELLEHDDTGTLTRPQRANDIDATELNDEDLELETVGPPRRA